MTGMASANVVVTKTAARTLRRLDSETFRHVVDFLEERLESFTEEHDPVALPYTEGKYWVVKPVAGGPALVVTAGDASTAERELVVLAALAPDLTSAADAVGPASVEPLLRRAALGASILSAAVVADEAAAGA